MRDWELLAPIVDMVEEMMEENQVTTEECSALTVSYAAGLLESLGVNVFDDDVLFDYFAGYTAAVSTTHSLLHMMDTTELHVDAALLCDAIVSGTLQHLLPLMPLLPQEVWPDQ